jgi:hypothetical protein
VSAAAIAPDGPPSGVALTAGSSVRAGRSGTGRPPAAGRDRIERLGFRDAVMFLSVVDIGTGRSYAGRHAELLI